MELLNLYAKISVDKAEYDRGLEEASSEAHSFGDKLKSGLGSAVKAGAAALAGAANAMTGFGAASVKTGMEFDASMAQVAATMGKTVDEIGGLRDFAMEMGSKTAFSATEAANALNYMALAGYDAETSMKMLPNVLDLAAAGGMDLASASDMITDSQSALGLSLEETSSLVDKMAKASSKSNTDVAQLGAAILTVGGTAKDLAGGTTELATALGILADNGIKGAEGGTALRNIILSLGAPTDKAAKLMGSLGIKAFDSSGKMRPLADIFRDLNNGMAELSSEERQGILSDIFNKVDLKSASALMSAASSGVADMSAELKKAGIQWEKYADTAWMANSGIGGVVEEIAYNLETLGTSAEELQDYLHFEYDMDYADAAAAIKVVNRMIGQSGDRWDELSGHIDDSAGAASKAAKTLMENLAGDIKLFNSALEGAKIQVSESLMPVMRDFVQMGASGLSKMTEGFRKGGLSGAMEALGDTISTVLEKVIDFLPDAIEAGGRLLAAIGQGILDNIDSITDTATEIVIMLVQGLTEALPEIGKGAAELVSKLAEGIGEALPDLVPAAVEAVAGFAESLIDNADKLVDGAIALMEGLAEGIVNAIPIFVKKIPTLLKKLLTAIINNLPKILSSIAGLLGKLVEGILSGDSDVLTIISEIVLGKWIIGTLMGGAKKLFDVGKNLIGSFVKGISNGAKGVSGIFNNLRGVFSKGASGLKNIFSGIGSKASSFFSGIKNTFSSFKGTLSKLFSSGGGLSKLGDGFKSLLAKLSGPDGFFSKIVGKFKSIGETLTKDGGFFSKISGKFKGIGEGLGAEGGLFSKLRDGFKNVLSSLTGEDGFFSKISGKFKGIADWLTGENGLFSKLKNGFTKAWDVISGKNGFFSKANTAFGGLGANAGNALSVIGNKGQPIGIGGPTVNAAISSTAAGGLAGGGAVKFLGSHPLAKAIAIGAGLGTLINDFRQGQFPTRTIFDFWDAAQDGSLQDGLKYFKEDVDEFYKAFEDGSWKGALKLMGEDILNAVIPVGTIGDIALKGSANLEKMGLSAVKSGEAMKAASQGVGDYAAGLEGIILRGSENFEKLGLSEAMKAAAQDAEEYESKLEGVALKGSEQFEKIAGITLKSREQLQKEFDDFKEQAATAAGSLWEPFSVKASSVWETVKGIFGGAWDWLSEKLGLSISNVTDTVSEGVDNAVGFLSGGLDGVSSMLSGTWEGIKAAFSEGWSQVEGSTEEGTAAITAAVSSGMASTESAAATGLETIKGTFQGAWENLKGGAEGGSKSILGTVKGMLSSIGNEAESTSGKAKTWGSDMMENFNKGVSSWKDKIAETVRGIAEKIKKNIGFSEPEEGPLSDFHTYAPDMMQLFISGIKQNEKALMNQVNKTFDFSEAVVQPPQPEVAARMAAAGAKGAAAGAAQPQSVTVILELDKQQLAKAVYSLNNSERQRVGLSLAKGFA